MSDFGDVIQSTDEDGRMGTAVNAAASSEQVLEPAQELTEDELALVSGGKTSSNSTMQSDVNPQ